MKAPTKKRYKEEARLAKMLLTKGMCVRRGPCLTS
jgi:hypothetical protein